MKVDNTIIEGEVAEFSQNRNDLSWNWWHSVSQSRCGIHVKRLHWTGYNDAYWWQNVAPTDMAQIRECSCGKKFRLNFKTNEISEV